MSSIHQLIKKLGFSATLFLSGVGAMYLADLALLRYASEETVASWALLRSFMMLGGTVALFGFQGLLVREPKALKKIATIASPHLLISAMLLGLLAAYMGWVKHFGIGVGVILGYALANYGFQWLRSTGRLSAAYGVNSVWRVLFFFGVLFGVSRGDFDLSSYLLLGFFASLLLALLLLKITSVQTALKSVNDEIKTYPDVVKLGGTLFLGSFSLAVSAHGESLVVNHLGETADVSLYYQALVLFLFPGIVFSQYLVAVLEPSIRNNKEKVNGLLRRYGGICFIGLLLSLTPLIWIAGWILQQIISPSSVIPLSLSLLLASTSALRIIYAFPSAYVGMVAHRKDLLQTMSGYFVSALCILPVAYLLHILGNSVIISVALASLINWTARFALAGRVIIKNIHPKES